MCAGPTTYPHKHGRAHQRARTRASPSSPHCLPFLLSPTFFFLFSGEEARRRRVMSSSSSASRQWRKYGPVPLTRCPDCPRMEPLKRLTCMREENGNRGRDFVKCLSRPQPGQVRSVYFTNRMVYFSQFFLFRQIWAMELGLDLEFMSCRSLFFRFCRNAGISSGSMSTLRG